MDLLSLSTEWAESEVFSTRFFILFAILFFIASLGFWQLGKTDLAKAYIIPTSVAAILLLVVGFGLFFTNKSRIKQFNEDYNLNSISFYESEIKRTESTLKDSTSSCLLRFVTIASKYAADTTIADVSLLQIINAKVMLSKIMFGLRVSAFFIKRKNNKTNKKLIALPG